MRDGRRVARIDVPEMNDPIDPFTVQLVPVPAEGTAHIGVDVRWTQLSSSRLRFHYFVAFARRFEFIV